MLSYALYTPIYIYNQHFIKLSLVKLIALRDIGNATIISNNYWRVYKKEKILRLSLSIPLRN